MDKDQVEQLIQRLEKATDEIYDETVNAENEGWIEFDRSFQICSDLREIASDMEQSMKGSRSRQLVQKLREVIDSIYKETVCLKEAGWPSVYYNTHICGYSLPEISDGMKKILIRL